MVGLEEKPLVRLFVCAVQPLTGRKALVRQLQPTGGETTISLGAYMPLRLIGRVGRAAHRNTPRTRWP